MTELNNLVIFWRGQEKMKNHDRNRDSYKGNYCCSNKANLKSPKLRSVILELYQDKKTFLPKPGAFSQVNKTSLASVAGKGGVLRFNGTLRDRLKKSYDIENMNLKTIISKMGPEVNNSKWVK